MYYSSNKRYNTEGYIWLLVTRQAFIISGKGNLLIHCNIIWYRWIYNSEDKISMNVQQKQL